MITAQQLASIIKGAIDKKAYIVLSYIRAEMGRDRGSAYSYDVFAPNKTNKLQVGSGKLLRSFTPKQAGNINKLTEQNGLFDWEFGSELPYAAFHEKGGFIKAKKMGRGGRTAMESYFWAMYYKSSNPYMKNLALAVHKRGGVNVPARPFFEPAFKKFESKELDSLLNEIFTGIKNEFERI